MNTDNTGNQNVGEWNSGNQNTGNRNAGNLNTGHLNAGDLNTGNRNAGNLNTGYRNAGNWNSGRLNSGNWNTGDWNKGDWNTGFFNTTTQTVQMFNKDTGLLPEELPVFPDFLFFDLTEWLLAEEMTPEEKAENPEHETMGGYLKVYEYKEAWALAWAEATEDDKQQLFALPNFDAEVFKEISGIDVKESTKELTVEEIERELGYKIKIIK